MLVAGCAAEPADGPAFVAVRRPTMIDGLNAIEVRTPHYRVVTTVKDDAIIDRFARVMETAHPQYAALVPPNTVQDQPLDIVLFARPEEWDAYTRRLTGPDAAVYLSVGPGGYAYGDRVVCWLFNENDLWGVATHEGFHQYVARHLPARMPPALEEGLASTFEDVRVGERSVVIDRRSNARREQGLSAATEANALLPLSDLIRGHAGDIAGQPLVIREGFYGQCWALARLLTETPATADGLRRMLADLRDGRSDGVGRTTIGGLYQPAAARPLLQKYVAPNWPAFERAFGAWVRRESAFADRSE